MSDFKVTPIPDVTAPFISVIVACYNIEGCVTTCVGSLLDQDYEHYELVLVDDGSIDSTPTILDGYVSVPGVKVIHKKNGGLSDARNHGVATSSGEYVVFVDGDDVVSPYFLSSLARCVKPGEMSMAVGSFRIISEDRKSSIRWQKPASAEKIDRAEAMRLLCLNKITESSCAKLMPRELCLKVPFPEERFYEDLSVIGDRLLMCDEVYVVDDPIYGYVMRKESITHTSKTPFVQVEDYFGALLRLKSVVLGGFPELFEVFSCREMLTYARIYMLLPAVEDKKGEAGRVAGEIEAYFSGLRRDIARNQMLSLAERVRYIILGACPWLYRVIMSFQARIKLIGK